MIRKHNTRQQNIRYQYRINERIFSSELRVLDTEGKQIGILPKFEALKLAREHQVDLVEIAPLAKPPVAKIIDFNKFLYQQQKKKQEEKRKAKVTETKEVRFGPHISDNDLQVLITRCRGFLEEGNKVKLVVKFKGRQIIHPSFGFDIIKKVTDALVDLCKIDKAPRLEGKQLLAVISPEKRGKQNEEKNQTVGTPKV